MKSSKDIIDNIINLYEEGDITSILNNSDDQQTISKPISINGIGLHSGKSVSMQLYPAQADYGIKFIRKDLIKNNIIEALWSNVSNTNLSTTISNNFGVSISIRNGFQINFISCTIGNRYSRRHR